MDASKTWPNACSMNNMVDNLGDCGAGNSVDLGGDVSFSASKEFGDGWEIGLGISADSGETSRGIVTKEGTTFADGLNAEYYLRFSNCLFYERDAMVSDATACNKLILKMIVLTTV